MPTLQARTFGVCSGLLSSASYGMIPLFSLPLLVAGVNAETQLVYRFTIATIAMGIILAIKGESIKISLWAFLKVTGVSLFYMFEVLFYFYALSYLPSGIVATLLFLYPVMVLLIMTLFFHERLRWHTAMAVILAVTGVALLSLAPGGGVVVRGKTMTGILLSLLSGLFTAFYIVGIQVAKLPKINDLVMTFYVMLTGSAFCVANALFTDSFVLIVSFRENMIAVLMALVTAIFSNLTLILAVKSIGSTLASILGVMEPLTAVGIGCIVFGEPFTMLVATGCFLIVAAVGLALLTPKSQDKAT